MYIYASSPPPGHEVWPINNLLLPYDCIRSMVSLKVDSLLDLMQSILSSKLV